MKMTALERARAKGARWYGAALFGCTGADRRAQEAGLTRYWLVEGYDGAESYSAIIGPAELTQEEAIAAATSPRIGLRGSTFHAQQRRIEGGA